MSNELNNSQSSCNQACSQNFILRPDFMRDIKIHKNTHTCPLIYEVVPVFGCEFQCIYCNALGQEDTERFLPVNIDTNYSEFLSKEIEKHKKVDSNPIYYFTPKSDCFQNPLLETGVTKQILEVFKEKDCHYILVTKGVPTDDVFDLMIQTKNKCQVIITYGMPNEEIRKAVEPMATPLEDRVKFAKKCIDAGIQTAAILEPFFPFRDLSFVKDIMEKFVNVGVDHFAVDFARITRHSLDRLLKALPQYADELKENYLLEDSHTESYNTAGGIQVERYSPPKKYMLEKFNYFKKLAREWDSTVSICNSFGFDGFNMEAGQRGYICMGINMKKVTA